MNNLYDTLKVCIEWVRRHGGRGRSINEENTKFSLVVPVIAAGGWDVHDPGEVRWEYRRQPAHRPVDCALLLEGAAWVLIEVKALGARLDPRAIEQTFTYAMLAGVRWVVLTNGVRWEVYNAYASVPVDQKLFFAADIDDTEAASTLLSLLGKDSIRDGRIDRSWEAFCVDRQVHAVLGQLFGDGELRQELAEVVGRRLPEVAADEVRESLARVHTTFEFPLPPTPSAGAGVTGPKSPPAELSGGNGQPRRVAGRYQLITAAEKRLSLSDLVTHGRLASGATLEGRYFGQRHTAELLEDCRIRYGGRAYSSLSAAGEAVKKAVRGPEIPESVYATDGWDFWRAEDRKTGEVVSLRILRRRTADDLAGG